MHVVYERCAGLDVHKRTVVACATTPNADGQPQKDRQTFSTMTVEICQMRDWRKRVGGDPCGDGKYRSLLEADLQCTRRSL